MKQPGLFDEPQPEPQPEPLELEPESPPPSSASRPVDADARRRATLARTPDDWLRDQLAAAGVSRVG